MPKLLVSAFVLWLTSLTLLSQNTPPTITVIPPSGIKEAALGSIAVDVDDAEGDSLSYNWTIASDPTGNAGFYVGGFLVSTVTSSTQPSVGIGLRHGSSFPNPSYVGSNIVFRVEVSDGTDTAMADLTVPVVGVNQEPNISIDTTRMGTPTNPRISPSGFSANGKASVDPDGGEVAFFWTIVSTSGGTICNGGVLVLFGKETAIPSFGVPKVSAPPSSPMSVTLEVFVQDGLHKITQRFTGYIAAANGCSSAPPATLSATASASPSTATFGQQVNLTGNASGGVTPYTYTWTQLSASTGVSLQGGNSRVASFVAPNEIKTLSFRFNVRDGTSAQVNRTVNVNVVPSGGGGGGGGGGGTGSGSTGGTVVCTDQGNTPAEATVPETFTIEGGNQAVISATGGRDPDNTIVFVSGINVSGVFYEWTVVDGAGLLTTSSLQSRTKPTVRFDTPQVAQPASLVLSVLVKDAKGCGRRYDVNVNLTAVENPNVSPTANLTYQINEGPAQNSSAQLVSVISPTGVILDGSGSSDPEGSVTASFNMQSNLSPGGATLTELSGQRAQLQIQAGSIGTLSVTMTVTNSDNATAQASQGFSVTEPVAVPIGVAKVVVSGTDLGVDAAVAEGVTVTLDGSDSHLPEGGSTGLTYQWQQLTGSPVTLVDADQVQAMFRSPEAAVAAEPLRFRLTVFNGATPSDPVSVDIRIILPPLFVSQAAFGPFLDQVFQTVVVLVNSQDVAAEDVKIAFFDQQGNSLPTMLDGEPWDPEQPFTIGPSSSRRLRFSGQDPEVTVVGWSRIDADVRLTGLVLYQLLNSETGEIDSEVSLFATERGSKFTTFFSTDDGLAAAIVNPEATEARLVVKLIDENFGPDLPLAQRPLILAPGQHQARFLDETYFGLFPPGFESGTLVIEAISGRVAVTVLKTRNGVGFSTLPLARR